MRPGDCGDSKDVIELDESSSQYTETRLARQDAGFEEQFRPVKVPPS